MSLLDTCPHCGHSVLFVNDYCPSCGRSRVDGSSAPGSTGVSVDVSAAPGSTRKRLWEEVPKIQLSPKTASLFDRDRGKGFPDLPPGEGPHTIAEFDYVVSSAVQMRNPKHLCQLRLTDIGLFLLGLTTFEKAEIDSLEFEAGAKTLLLGVAGAMHAQHDIDAMKRVQGQAIARYDEVRTSIQALSLCDAFAKAPQGGLYLRPSDVKHVQYSYSKDERMRIDTTCGSLEFLVPLDDAATTKLRQWWRGRTMQEPAGEPGVPWTLTRVLLQFRESRDISSMGLACFCRTLAQDDAVQCSYEVLRSSLPFGAFWAFVSQLRRCDQPNAQLLASTAISGERDRALGRLFTGVGMMVIGPALVHWLSDPILQEGGFRNVIIGLLTLAAAGMTIFGLFRIIAAIINLFRCWQEAAKTSLAH